MESVKNKMKTLTILFTVPCLFVLICICADTGRLPDFIKAFYCFPFGDKVGHILIMGFFTFIFQLCFTSNKKLIRQD
jgi:hypothetical protein